MTFEMEYQQMMHKPIMESSGERKRRLTEVNLHAEKLFLENVWWQAFGNLEHLHPEFEIVDYRGRPRFLDFAFKYLWIRMVIEIQGFGSHVKQVSRWDYINEMRRIRLLSHNGWILMYFSFDEIKDHSGECQRELQQIIGRLLGENKNGSKLELSPVEKELILFALRNQASVRPIDVSKELLIHRTTVYHYISKLVDKGWLLPEVNPLRGNPKRINSYKLNMQRNPFQL